MMPRERAPRRAQLPPGTHVTAGRTGGCTADAQRQESLTQITLTARREDAPGRSMALGDDLRIIFSVVSCSIEAVTWWDGEAFGDLAPVPA
jgi:hypothetical protein